MVGENLVFFLCGLFEAVRSETRDPFEAGFCARLLIVPRQAYGLLAHEGTRLQASSVALVPEAAAIAETATLSLGFAETRMERRRT